MSLTLALIVATGGILAGALGPALAEGDKLWPIAWILWAPVGYLIVLKRPGNAVGTAALLIGLLWGVGFALLTPSVSVSSDAAAAWFELGDSIFGVLPWLVIVWLLLVFPSGAYPTKSERTTGWVLVAFGALTSIAFAVDPAQMEDTGLPSPLAVAGLGDVASVLTGDGGFIILVAFLLMAVVLMVVRWRRSAGVERLQYRWLFLGSMVFLLIVGAGSLGLIPEDGVVPLVWLVAGGAIPAAIGIAVLRYRLYDIDRIVSRTVSYVVVVGLLAAVFFGVVTATSTLLDTSDDLVIAASTLAVAALVQPCPEAGAERGWTAGSTDPDYDAQLVMDGFAGSLRDRVDRGRRGRRLGWCGRRDHAACCGRGMGAGRHDEGQIRRDPAVGALDRGHRGLGDGILVRPWLG